MQLRNAALGLSWSIGAVENRLEPWSLSPPAFAVAQTLRKIAGFRGASASPSRFFISSEVPSLARRFMPRKKRTPEEVRRLKARGLFDVGTFYIQKRPFDREPKHEHWGRDE